MRQLTSLLRIFAGLVGVGVLVVSMVPLLVLLFPFRVKRIHVTNFYGTLLGRWAMFCAGVRVRVRGTEHIGPDKPAIYACNHTSTLDAFTTIWLTPKGTVGVAKKEILYYPFYGQAWWLAGHVFLDRGQTDKAKASLRRAGELIREKGLHVCILPEGTRSRSGRLLPFKKGFVHLALETRLPIVPMVTIGLQNAWKKSSFVVEPCDVEIVFLPPISTEGWSLEHIDEHVATVRDAIAAALPPEQQPE